MAKKKEIKKSTDVVEKDNKNISPINRFNILFVDLQAIFTLIAVVLLILYLLNVNVYHAFQIVLGITMIIIGYNQKIVYNKPKMSWVYYICGVILIVCDILSLLGIGG